MTEKKLQSETGIIDLANCILSSSGLSEKELVRCVATEEGIEALADQLASQVSAQAECLSTEPRAQLSAIRSALRHLATSKLAPKVQALLAKRRQEGDMHRKYGAGVVQAVAA